MNQVTALQTGKGAQMADLSCEERAERLNTLFQDKIIPFSKEINVRSVNSQADGQLYYNQVLEYQNRNMKAEIIKAKFEQITREYNGQNKQFQEKHTEIAEAEAAKREDINKNFDEHINSIKAQMEEDVAKSRAENNEITEDTKQLTEKYEELKKETEEKMEIMSTQLSEQGSKQGDISTQLDT